MKRSMVAVVAGLCLAGGVALAQSNSGDTGMGTGSAQPNPGMQGQGTNSWSRSQSGSSRSQWQNRNQQGANQGQLGQGQMGQSGQMGQMGQMGQTGEAAGTMGRGNVEAKKHLAEVDLYLRNAINNTKLLYQTAQLQPGKLDTTIQKEDLGNVEKSLGSALTHVSHLQTLASARIAQPAQLDLLKSDLTRARTMATRLRGQLGTADRAEVGNLSSQLYTQLRAADDAFAQIAQSENLVRLDGINVPEREPVGGSVNDQGLQQLEQPGGSELNPPSESPLNGPSGGSMNNPGGSMNDTGSPSSGTTY